MDSLSRNRHPAPRPFPFELQHAARPPRLDRDGELLHRLPQLLHGHVEPGEGSVHREYLPAGTGVPAMTRSALVSNTVAWFAPVRHTWFQGTTFPKITRPRVEGRL